MNRILILMSLLSFACIDLFAQAAERDLLFGKKGVVTKNIGANYQYNSIAKQVLVKDSSFYLILSYPFIVSKTFQNGSVDSSYGLNGYATYAPLGTTYSAFQPDGKMVIVGYLGITRLTAMGFTDTSFGTNGVKDVSFPLRSVVIQADGKIVVAGGENESFLVARYNSDGSNDQSFNNGNTVVTDFNYNIPCEERECRDSVEMHSGRANAILVQKDGKIIVAGSAFTLHGAGLAIARYEGNGSADSTFGHNGKQITKITSNEDDYGYSLALQKDEKIIFAGYSVYSSGDKTNFAVVRYTTNGKPDSTFDKDGVKTVRLGMGSQANNSVAIQNDGKIVVAGNKLQGINNGFFNNDFALVRLTANGTPDSSFDKDGIVTTDFDSSDDQSGSVGLQSDGKIIVAGYSYTKQGADHLSVCRYNSDGSLDEFFYEQGKFKGDFHQGFTEFYSLEILPDKKLVVAGLAWNGSNYDFALTRLNTLGATDSTFGNAGIQITNVGLDENAPALAIQKDGKIIMAGSTNVNNAPSPAVFARYTAGGKVDSSFAKSGILTYNSGGLFTSSVGIVLQSTGKMVALLRVLDASYNTYAYVLRFNVNGTKDSSFGINGLQKISPLPDAFIPTGIALQKDDKLLLTGYNIDDGFILRLKANGGFDDTFSEDGWQLFDFGLQEAPQAIAVQNDGKILVAGGSRSGHARLISRYTVHGSLDSAFADNGKQITPEGSIISLALQTNNKILAAVKFNDNNMAISRWTVHGHVDESFGNAGLKPTGISTSYGLVGGITIDSNKLYAFGSARLPGFLGVIERYDLKENNPPVVHLTLPVNNATYLSGGNVYLKAVATDADGSIARIEFYNGATLLYTVTDTPYTFKWEHVAKGNYVLTAKATDNLGAVATSAPVNISVVRNKPPIISLISPANGQVFIAPVTGATINLEAIAQDADGRIIQVSFYAGEALLTAAEHKAPYTYQWQNVPPGTYTLRAVARDNWSAQATSTPVTVTVIAAGEQATGGLCYVNGKHAIAEKLSLVISPNPVKNILHVNSSILRKSNQKVISIIAASGIVIKTWRVKGSDQALQLDVASLASGMYILRIASVNEVIYRQFVKL